jgi:hypothetical protein
MTNTLTKAPCTSLIVPPGTPLVAGKLYLRLYHGRKDPAQEMQEWGFDGPTFGPLFSVVQTYFATIRLCHSKMDDDFWLDVRDRMIVWNGSYYGHFAVFIAGRQDNA